jgi:outer membrane lipoprotein-sorting protein
MSRRFGIFALAAFVCVAGSGPSARQSVDDIIGRNIEAKGGLARWKAIESLKQTATLTMQGMEASLVIWAKRPNMIRQEVTLGPTLIINAFDGQMAWILNPLAMPPGTTARPVIVSGPQADMIREQSSFDGPLMDYKGHGATVVLEGNETIGTRKVVHLRLTSRTRQVSHIYLDAETWLEAKITSEGDQLKLEQEFSDYRVVDGVKIPFVIRTSTNGVQQGEIRLRTVEFNPRIDEALFRLPK